MTIKDRIEVFIEHQGIRRSVFEKQCGFSNGYTRNLKENPSASKIEDILNAYPEINRVWLLSGEGEMLQRRNNNDPPERIASLEKLYRLLEDAKKENARLLSIIESQQCTIEILAELAKKDCWEE